MNRTFIINYYLRIKKSSTHYLEIGVRNPDSNFNRIIASVKDGVDIDPKSECSHIMSSDKFFAMNSRKYDVIFIDGDHLFKQVYKDAENSLRFLKDGGIIIMHDCNPPTEQHQFENIHNGPWNGTVWKAFVKLRMERSDLKMFVIDVDYGVGIIDPSGSQIPFSCKENIYDYSVFEKYRKEALNLITTNEWIKSWK